MSISRLCIAIAIIVVAFVAVSTTAAYLYTQTPPIVNTFIAGEVDEDARGSIAVSATLQHPFGEDYEIPSDLAFPLAVNIGSDYADTVFGDYRTDSEGVISIAALPGKSYVIEGVPAGIEVVVTEDLSDKPGFSASALAQRVTVVQDKTRSAEFENTYVPAPAPAITVTGEKKVVGRNLVAGDSFSFLVRAKFVDGWQDLGTKTVEYEAGEDQDDSEAPALDSLSIDFSDIVSSVPFNAPGVYSFKVLETYNSIDGDTGSSAPFGAFDVTVGDETMDGALEVQRITTSTGSCTQVSGTGVHVVFKSDYTEVAHAELDLTVSLDDESGQGKDPEGFVFTLHDERGNTVMSSAPTPKDGTAQMRLSFTADDIGRTIAYTLDQVYGGQTIKALTYDAKAVELLATVVSAPNGEVGAFLYEREDGMSYQSSNNVLAELGDVLVEQAYAADGISDELRDAARAAGVPDSASTRLGTQFANTYKPEPATVTLQGKVSLSGKKAQLDQFHLMLYQTDADFDITGRTPIQQVTNASTLEGFAFPPLTLSKVGTYYYVIYESEGQSGDQGSGYKYDPRIYHVLVQVVDEDGVLVSHVSIMDENGFPATLEFDNTYSEAAAQEGAKGDAGSDRSAAKQAKSSSASSKAQGVPGVTTRGAMPQGGKGSGSAIDVLTGDVLWQVFAIALALAVLSGVLTVVAGVRLFTRRR